MLVERQSPLPLSPPLAADEITRLAKLPPERAAAIAPLIRPAINTIEARWGVVADLGDYRIAFDVVPPKKVPLNLPISPAVALHSFTISGENLADAALYRGRVMPPTKGWPADSTSAEAIVLAGWAAEEVPHLLRLVVARICAYWLLHADGVAKGDIGNLAVTAGQYLELFVPVRAGKGGDPWRR